MGLVIPNGFAQVIINLSLIGDPEEMKLTYGIELEVGGPSQAMVNALHDAGDGTIDLFCGSGYTFESSTLLTSTQIFESTTASYPGINAGDSVTPNVATLVRKRTGLRNRINQGRLFIPGLEEAAVDDNGVIGPATVTALQAAITSWATAVLAVTDVENVVILHTSVTDTPTPVTSLAVENVVATQRGRLRR